MAGAVVQLRGGLGNQLWQLSAALVIGGGHVAALAVADDAAQVVTDDTQLAAHLCPQWRCQSSSLLQDFWTLCRAELSVMSSSSLSRWAAYCGQARQVIFPRLWPVDFGAGEEDVTCAKSGQELVFDTAWCLIHD